MKLEVRNLNKKYGSVCALNGVHLTVAPGDVIGILGPNGCGKSTLIKNILGLTLPDEGDIWVDQHSILEQSDYRLRIGYMPQNPQFPENLKVEEIFSMLQDIRQQGSARLAELLNSLNLNPSLSQRFGDLSGGTKQKVAAVVAMMFEPELLILDEPTVGLDPLSAVAFKELLKQERKSGKSILIVNHILSEIQSMVEDVIFMLEGRVVFQGTLKSLMMSPSGVPFESLEKAVVELLSQMKNSSGSVNGNENRNLKT